MKIKMTDQLSSKYLNMSELLAQDFFVESYKGDIDVDRFVIPDTYRLIFINGQIQLALSSFPEDLFKTDSTGCFLQVAPNQTINSFLHIINIHKNTAHPSWQELKFFIDLGVHSALTILEEHVGVDEGPYLNTITTDIHLGKRARLHYYKLQRDSWQAYHLSTMTVSQQADSVFHYVGVSNGAKLNRDDLTIQHRDSGSFAQLDGLFRARHDSQVMQHTRADHFSGGCTTHQHYRGLASDHARGIFDGQMIVHPGAAKSSVHQSNHNLLLSNTAEIDSKPTLEIYVDDVLASHGATIGQLDEEALFYCQSRGISFDEARRLLVSGFVSALFDDIPSNDLSDYVKQAVMEDL